MSLKEEIQNELKAAMDGDLAEAVKAFTYTPIVGTAYSPGTGQVTPPAGQASGRGIFFEAAIIESLTVPTADQVDTKAIVLQNELSVSPEISGLLVTTGDGQEYGIVYVKSDPVGATWELYMKRQTTTEEE